MLRPSTDSKYLGLIQIVLCQTKNIVTNCGGYRQKDDFRLYLVNSKYFSGLAQKIGLVQNILEHVEGQGIYVKQHAV